MNIIPSSAGLAPFEIIYGRPFVLPQLKLFTRRDEEKEETAEYIVKMLTSKEISSVLSIPGDPVEESLKPGDWILIKVIKEKN